jgi:hypothetical protein
MSLLGLDVWIWLAVVGGTAVRLTAYAADRSIGLDESLISLNILRRDAFDVLRKLDWNSGAPLGFLEAEKAVTWALGSSEHALRLVPFLASVASLLLVALAGRKMLSRVGVLIAVAALAMLPRVVEYAAVVKQYSTDIAVVLGILLLAIWGLALPLTRLKAAMLALAFALTPLLSHPSAFVALSAAVVLVASHLLDSGKRSTRLVAVVAVSSLVAATFAGILYFFLLRGIARSLAGEGLGSIDDVRDLVGAVRTVMGLNPSSAQPWATIDAVSVTAFLILYCVGVVAIARRRWEHAALLVLPLGFAIAGIALSAYPNEIRTLLFVAPLLVLPLAGGAAWFVARRGVVRVIGVLAVFLVLVPPATRTFDVMEAAWRPDDRIRAAMTYLARHQHPGDVVFLWQTTQYPFAFELECSCFHSPVPGRSLGSLWPVRSVPGTHSQWSNAIVSESDDFVIGAYREPREESFEEELRRLRGTPRVWVLLSALEPDKRASLVQRLDRLGRKLESFDATADYEGVDVYLYDLRTSRS